MSPSRAFKVDLNFREKNRDERFAFYTNNPPVFIKKYSPGLKRPPMDGTLGTYPGVDIPEDHNARYRLPKDRELDGFFMASAETLKEKIGIILRHIDRGGFRVEEMSKSQAKGGYIYSFKSEDRKIDARRGAYGPLVGGGMEKIYALRELYKRMRDATPEALQAEFDRLVIVRECVKRQQARNTRKPKSFRSTLSDDRARIHPVHAAHQASPQRVVIPTSPASISSSHGGTCPPNPLAHNSPAFGPTHGSSNLNDVGGPRSPKGSRKLTKDV